jgi:hypothetical protein
MKEEAGVMNSVKHILSWFLVVSLMFSCSIAQQVTSATESAVVPRLVNYSGKATDAQGKIITGITGATFAIYKEQYEGSPLWLETQNIQADTKGNYTVQLGATKPAGLPLDLFSSGEARWLGVTVNGGQEQPRVLLLSVPYALKAADAETIGGLPPSAFVLAGKNQGSALSAKAAPASTPATKNAALPTNPAVTGKGVLDFIPMWDSASDIVDSIMFQKSSQVGINTVNPAVTLDVNGKGDVRDTLTLVPKGTDPTLVVNGTNFKVDQTGKVTFIPSQIFPGTGSVTSVGLSAPTADFTVTGSPVTKSGTLNLNWNVAPTSNNTLNAIVKRDASGNFTAGQITGALGVFGLSPDANSAVAGTNSSNGFGVFGISSTGTGIWGQSNGTGTTSTGVEGVTNSDTAYGVAGSNRGNGVGVLGTSVSGHGVYGSTSGAGSYGVVGLNSATGGVGVLGSAPNGDGFYTVNNVYQDRSAGGWVKAMAYVSGFDPGRIVSCFNSTLIGAPATVAPCGFSINKLGAGTYVLDFGFQIDDRMYSLTTTNWFTTTGLCTDWNGACSGGTALTPNQVEVLSFEPSINNYTDVKFYIVVY